jgi:hypothetical protein
MERRFPSLTAARYGGYSTDGKENFDAVVQFNFDYSDVDATVREVKKEVEDLGYELKQTFKALGLSGSGRGGKGFYVSPKAAASFDRVETGLLDSTFKVLPDGDRIRNALQPALQDLGKDGKATMQKYANRIDTGLMRGSIKYSTRKYKTKYTVNIGWTELWYKYFGFQENGTKSIPPMRSVLRTYLELTPRVQNFMSRFIRSYTRRGNNSGGATYR